MLKKNKQSSNFGLKKNNKQTKSPSFDHLSKKKKSKLEKKKEEERFVDVENGGWSIELAPAPPLQKKQ